MGFEPDTATITGDVEMITTGANDFFYLDVTKDGRFVALTTSSRTREDLYVLTVADGSIRQLTNDFARDRQPRWSHDAGSIYFFSDRRGGDIWRINSDGGGLRELANQPGLMPLWPTPSPDGARLAASDQNVRQFAIYDTRDFSKPLQVVTAPVEPQLGALRVQGWSPDSRSFLVVADTPSEGPGLWTYAVDTGTARRITDCDLATWMTDGQRLICTRVGRRTTVVNASTGRATELPMDFLAGGPRLAADDTQLFFLRSTTSADIWIARFSPATSR